MKIKEILTSIGLKPTIQRIKIYNYLITHKTHPDVENIYKELKKEIPTISKTTIYNTLKEFVQKGLIIEIPTEYKLCFDADIHPHSHFICSVCGKIYDLNIEFSFVRRKIIKGHLIKKFCGIFKGICFTCRKEKNDEFESFV
ncbi:MAG: transcriptional repressor [Endomicrobia bacterium]|nr:transcriptional repressor [Endomicrobiia bacterium]